MKRSKIFLAATAGILGVVGFISAKAHSHFSVLHFYTTTSRGGSCTVYVTAEGTTVDNGNPQIGFTKYSSNLSGCGNEVFPGE